MPTEEIIIEPTVVQQDPAAYRLIGEEITQQLDYYPPVYLRRLFIRRKYVAKADRDLAPILGDFPARLIPGGYAGAGLLTDIILKKYVDHLPLYRQEQILRTRHGIELSRRTMSDWVAVVADWLGPIYRQLREEVRQGGYLQVDETPVRYCQAEGGGSAQGYLWTYHQPPPAGRQGGTVLFEWHPGRGANRLRDLLADFRGQLQCDGYSAYGCYARERNAAERAAGRDDAIELSGCWAHARRKIYEARDEAPNLAGWLLNQVGHLYRLEAQLRERRAGPRLRQAERAAHSRMILARIRRVLQAKIGQFLPRGRMGGAMKYILGLWEPLERFCAHGHLEIDNNGVENAIRPTAVGKKNWLFVGHPEAGQRSAVIYTVLENCKRQQINPWEYLHDVLSRLPTLTNQQTRDLTPARWAATRRKARAA